MSEKKNDKAKELVEFLLKKGETKQPPTKTFGRDKPTRRIEVPDTGDIEIDVPDTRLSAVSKNPAPTTIQKVEAPPEFELDLGGASNETELDLDGPLPEGIKPMEPAPFVPPPPPVPQIKSGHVDQDAKTHIESAERSKHVGQMTDITHKTEPTPAKKVEPPTEVKPAKELAKTGLTVQPPSQLINDILKGAEKAKTQPDPMTMHFGELKDKSNVLPSSDKKAVKLPSMPSSQSQLSKSQQSTRGASIFNEVQTLVGGAEAIRVAQARINQLEQERDQLRVEIEKLLSSSESLQKKVGELKSIQESSERKHREKVEILEEEKAVLKGRMVAREQELNSSKRQIEEMAERFQADLRRVRVRERELEGRYEMLKAETQAVVKSKDEMILELRRQLEQLSFELDNFRAKSADLNSKVSEFHERNYRTVKALRLALSVLETGDSDEKGKKVS